MKTSALAANKLSPGGHTLTTQVVEGLTSIRPLTRSHASEVATDGSTDDGSTDGSNRKRKLVLVEGTSAPVKMDIAAKAVRASASAANEPAVGDSRKRKAETQEPPPIEEDICKGVVRRAAAWRQKYNPSRKKRKLHVDSCGFHMLNRDGIACNGDRCDDLTGQIIHDGTDPDEAQRDNFVIRASGPDDPSRAFNIEVCSQHPKLALPENFEPFYFTLAHSHLMQVMRNINHRAKSDVPGITDQEGCLSLALVEQTDRRLARLCTEGFDCEVFPYQMSVEEPESIQDIAIAANIKHGTHLMETEMQGLVRLGRVCSAEQSAAEGAMFESVREKIAATMPKIALSEDFVDLFALAVNLGAGDGPFLNELADFHGQWVNPKIRKLRVSTLGRLGTIPISIDVDGTRHTIPPLIVAILKAAYACSTEKYLKDDYLEYLSTKDLKIDTTDVEQMARLVKALEVLKHFHVSCKGIIDSFSRGERIQFLGTADVRIANAFLEKGEETSKLPAIGYELQEELEKLCSDVVRAVPDDVELPSALPWFERPVADDGEDEALGPRIIQYDAEMRATSGQASRVEQEAVVEVLPARVSEKLEADEHFKSEMVLGLLQAFLKFGKASPPAALVEVRRIKQQVNVYATVDIEEGALLMVPVVRTTQGIALIKQDVFVKKWDTTISLAPALAAKDCLKPGTDADKEKSVWVLLQQKKLPPKRRAKNDTGEKDEVYHAWLAKRVPYEEVANCAIKWCTMSVVRTFGGHHSDVQEVSVPVFANTQRIEAGAEIKIFAKKDETSADKKKEKKGETWREITKKQEKSDRMKMEKK